MSSLFLGKIGTRKNHYEIHAFTNGLSFRQWSSSEIGDIVLFKSLLNARWNLLAAGKPIFCTAIAPNAQDSLEYNAHDDREGTVHVVALDRHGEIECGLSYAVDGGDRNGGSAVGVPLENRYGTNGYPEGGDLTPFRTQFLRKNYVMERDLLPGEMVELYRHFRRQHGVSRPPSLLRLAARIGLYAGGYHLLVRTPRLRRGIESWLWVFDAIPSYYNLYRLAAGSVLRDPTLDTPPKWLAPNPARFVESSEKGFPRMSLGNRVISRSVSVPIPRIENGTPSFPLRKEAFIDGLLDIHKLEGAIGRRPLVLDLTHCEGFSLTDRMKLRSALTLTGDAAFRESPSYNWAIASINWALRQTLAQTCDFRRLATPLCHDD